MRFLFFVMTVMAVAADAAHGQHFDIRLTAASADAARSGDLGQDVGQVDPARLYESLFALEDLTAVRALARALPDNDDGPALIAHGLAALRLFALTGDPEDAKLAERSFDRATTLAPRDAWARFGLGAALARIGEPVVPPPVRPAPSGFLADDVLAGALGVDARSRARDELLRALRLDPSHAPAARTLLHLGLERRDDDAIRAAGTALAVMAERDRAGADELLALSIAASAVGDVARAARAADQAATMAPERAAEASHALAVALLRTPGAAEQGANAYFDGIEAADTALLERYLEDVRHIADPREVAVFNTLSPAERRTWLREFWSMRAALAGVTPEARIAEHYRRLGVVQERFPRRRWVGVPPRSALIWERDPGMPYDDRGMVYLRHGEPLEAIRSSRAGWNPSETWVYRAPDGDFQLFNFMLGQSEDYADYLLLYDVPCDPSWLVERARYSDALDKLIARCSGARRRWAGLEIRRDVRVALVTDTDRPAFAESLPFTHQLYDFRAPDGRTEVVAAVGVEDTAVTRARVAFVVADTIFDEFGSSDTVVAAVAGGAATAGVAITTRPVPYGVYRIFVRDAGDSTRGSWFGDGVRVRDLGGPLLEISDLVLGAADVAPAYRRGSHAVALSTSDVFADGRLNVFYELYNVQPEARYATRIVVREHGGGLGRALGRLFGRGDPVELRFEDVAVHDADNVVRVTQEVSSGLPSGDYEIEVTVRIGRRAVVQTRRFTVP